VLARAWCFSGSAGRFSVFDQEEPWSRKRQSRPTCGKRARNT
jgi:hypothetical protein